MSAGRTALVLSGGPHPFEATTPRVVALLEGAGCTVEVVEDPDEAARRLDRDPPDLLVMNTLRWRMLAPRYDALRDEHAYVTSDGVRAAVPAYVRDGGRLLALHGAPICFDDWPGWGEVVGARWAWDRSSHPPLGKMDVRVVAGHPLTDGIGDFSLRDEAYGFMDLEPDVVALTVSSHGGADHPMLWVRTVGRGVVVTSTLGHGPESFDHPAHRELLRRSVALLLEPVGPPTGETV